jgi:LysR family cys regulon transcriptional activator
LTLKQLQYFVSIVDCGMNITAASEQLFTSQPGISKQIKLIEAELGIKLFIRKGKTLSALTPGGEEVLKKSRKILLEVNNITNFSSEMQGNDKGLLSIATTHTQARYVLPNTIKEFNVKYPRVDLEIHQGTTDQIAELLASSHINLVMASGSDKLFNNLIMIPVYRWNRVALVPKNHPLAKDKRKMTLDILAKHSLVTYVFSMAEESSFKLAFSQLNLQPRISFTARDADIIKTYVRKGMGVGLLASVAIEPSDLEDLHVIDVRDLFSEITTWIGIPREAIIRSYMFDFISMLAPHISRGQLKKLLDPDNHESYELMLSNLEVPSKYLSA